jgi:hypothetical protein
VDGAPVHWSPSTGATGLPFTGPPVSPVRWSSFHRWAGETGGPVDGAPSPLHPYIPSVAQYTNYEYEYEYYERKWDKKKIAIIIVLIVLTFFPIVALIFGQVYKNDCPIQTWIPQWLTIFGAVGLAGFAVLTFIVNNFI